MLYITTKNHNDAFTAHKALVENCAPDGGRFVPFRLPSYTAEEILAFGDKSFNATIADVLNLFFASKLQGIDVEFCIGKNIAKLVPMTHKIVIGEVWHNLDRSFSYVEKQLFCKLAEKNDEPTIWAQIAVRIAVLFGLYGEMLRNSLVQPGQDFDISVPDDYQLSAAAAMYGRKMGLPIRTIICSCQDNGDLWDFIHRGEINTAAAAAGLIPEIERLVQETLGFEELAKFREVCERGKTYRVNEESLPTLNKGLFCSVAGKDRALKTINSVYRSNSYIIDAKTALCYGGLQDYRAKTGESGLTLILAEKTPAASAGTISKATGIPATKLTF